MKNKCGRCGHISWGSGNICPNCHDPRYLTKSVPDHIYTIEVWSAPTSSEDMVTRELGAILADAIQGAKHLMAYAMTRL